MQSPRVLQITAINALPEPLLLARIAALAALPRAAQGAFAIQLRDPELTGRALLALGQTLRKATRAVGAALVVNDRLDLALALDADGVHLGRRSVAVPDARALLGPEAWISIAAHSIADVERALDLEIDAVLLSPIFPSPGKSAPLGPEALEAARAVLDRSERRRIDLVALGGVDRENALLCFEAGASAVASIRANLTALGNFAERMPSETRSRSSQEM